VSESDDFAKRTQDGTFDLKDATPPQNHSGRVTIFTIMLARALGLPKEQIDVIARGAYLHDIGKMAIPVDIWRKPSKLDADEIKVMREHCYHGYKLISDGPFLVEPAEIVYSHHEFFDGTGYPRRLRGSEIPLGARLVAVANTLDAITSDRPYSKARSFAEAREEIERWSGRQFDPQIVELFLAMPENIWQNLRKDLFGKRFDGLGAG
jgi:putative nucleotidyltransferase with HDIG domain